MRELIAKLAEEVKELSEKEQLVVSLFYYEELTLTEIGEILNCQHLEFLKSTLRLSVN